MLAGAWDAVAAAIAVVMAAVAAVMAAVLAAAAHVQTHCEASAAAALAPGLAPTAAVAAASWLSVSASWLSLQQLWLSPAPLELEAPRWQSAGQAVNCLPPQQKAVQHSKQIIHNTLRNRTRGDTLCCLGSQDGMRAF